MILFNALSFKVLMSEPKNFRDTTIGILGGMGPEATTYLYQLIMKYTPAKKDQDHIPTIIYQNTRIPNRPESIKKGEHEKIISILVDTAKKLTRAGADLILLPCNTVHYYHDAIQSRTNVPVYDMVDLTAEYLSEKVGREQKEEIIGLNDSSNSSPNPKRIFGLIGHDLLREEVYEKRFSSRGFQLISPPKSAQKIITDIIWNIKVDGPTSDKRDKLLDIFQKMRKKQKLNWIVLGCTELPLLFRNQSLD